MKKFHKDAFLRRCNELPTNIIKKHIDSGDITLEEYIESGLMESKVQEVGDLAAEEMRINRIKEENQEFYNQIENDEKEIDEIQDALNSGEIRKEGILENTYIDEKLLEKIIGYSQDAYSPENNKESLGAGTDIFFFGRSGSGKTCILASIFWYAEDNGLFIDDTNSMKGINYKNKLVEGIDKGVLPFRTPATQEAVTYISTTLVDENIKTGKQEKSPLNFIEMSGEFFQQAAQNPDSLKDSIDAHGYLSNSNRKLLFFIVDYDIRPKGNTRTKQSQDFQLVLNHLDKYKKALKNTHTVYIVVNKSDLFPKHVVDKNAFALEWFMNEFKAVYTMLRDKREKHKFKLVSLPYSLGTFIFKNSYLSEKCEESPKRLIKSIGKHSAFGRSRSYGIFSSNN